MTTRAGPYYCRLCDETLDEIPVGSILIRDSYYDLYQFPDGRLHDVRRVNNHTAQSAEENQ